MGSTTIVGDDDGREHEGAPLTTLMFVVAACPSEPERVGEVATVGPAGNVFGRGGSEPETKPAEARLEFFRQRPGVVERTRPFESPGLSRRQLKITREAKGSAFHVICLGQCPLVVNGVKVDETVVGDGDVVELRRELVLACIARAPLISPSRNFPASAIGDFGEPDSLGILGESPAAWRLRESIAFAAKAGTHVLLLGDSGSGKELAARGLHALSSRADRPFVARNAATLPAGLVDAELFGNARNYPNPGMSERAGLVGEADGGTLFLDEIGELSVELQSHLLRVLDAHGEYQRLGEATMRRSRFRLVAATNRAPSALKHDFLARFTNRVEVPPLSARREDLTLLARHLLRRAAERSPEIVTRFLRKHGDRTYPQMTTELVAALVRRDYPSNARDLETLLWQSMRESPGDSLTWTADLRESTSVVEVLPTSPPPPKAPEPSLGEIEDALARHGGNVSEAARSLSVSRFALHRLLKRHGLRGN